MAAINWNVDTISGLVPLATHSMYLRAAGPPRVGNEPAIIIEAGLGHNSALWAAVSRLLSSSHRVYSYDRSGLGLSEVSPSPRTASSMALELESLLAAADVQGPYVVVTHSYGGIISREFLALGAQIVGMVFVDANQEMTYRVRPAGLEECFGALLEGLEWNTIRGIEKLGTLTPAEWAAANAGSPEDRAKWSATVKAELRHYKPSSDVLGEKKQFERTALGDNPVVVLKAENQKWCQLLFDMGLERGNATEEQRAIFKAWLGMESEEEELQRSLLKLTTKGRWVQVTGSDHDVMLFKPQVIVDAVEWISDILKGR